MKKSFAIILVLFFGISHAQIKYDSITSIVAANPEWHESKGNIFYIGFQCSNLFSASNHYLRKQKYDDQRLIDLMNYYFEFYSSSSIRYSKDELLLNLDGMINLGNEIYEFYLFQMPTNFSTQDGQFKGLIKNDMRECLKSIKVFQNLPLIST